MADTSSLRDRIDACVRKRAALEERKTRAEKDKADAEGALKELGLKPKTARAAIEEAEAELGREVKEIEKMLGIAN
jgi:Holliday junction resolvasome RuvABC DNA-binding subunit